MRPRKVEEEEIHLTEGWRVGIDSATKPTTYTVVRDAREIKFHRAFCFLPPQGTRQNIMLVTGSQRMTVPPEVVDIVQERGRVIPEASKGGVRRSRRPPDATKCPRLKRGASEPIGERDSKRLSGIQAPPTEDIRRDPNRETVSDARIEQKEQPQPSVPVKNVFKREFPPRRSGVDGEEEG